MYSLCQKAFTIGTLRNVITAVNNTFDAAMDGLDQAALSGYVYAYIRVNSKS